MKTDADRITEVRSVMAAVQEMVADETRFEAIRPGRFREKRSSIELETNYTNGEATFTVFGKGERDASTVVRVRDASMESVNLLRHLFPSLTPFLIR